MIITRVNVTLRKGQIICVKKDESEVIVLLIAVNPNDTYYAVNLKNGEITEFSTINCLGEFYDNCPFRIVSVVSSDQTELIIPTSF